MKLYFHAFKTKSFCEKLMMSSHFSAYGKTIHSQTKYIIMDCFNQEAKNSRCSVNLTEGYW